MAAPGVDHSDAIGLLGLTNAGLHLKFSRLITPAHEQLEGTPDTDERTPVIAIRHLYAVGGQAPALPHDLELAR
jgi:hypothetical protein